MSVVKWSGLVFVDPTIWKPDTEKSGIQMNLVFGCLVIQMVTVFFTFSPVTANGALNHCSKVLQALKMEGSKKLRRAHNSGNLFCKGVPVNSSRLLEV